MSGKPGEHVAQRAAFLHQRERAVSRIAQGVIQALRHERVGLVDIATDDDEVHDREDAGAPIIVLLHLAVIGKQARDIGVRSNRLDRARTDHGIDFALGQELAERVARAIDLDVGLLEQRRHGRAAVRARPLERALHPADFRKVDAIFVLQQPTNPDRGAHGVERDADTFALEVFRRPNASLAIEENEAVPEQAGGKDRDGDERVMAGPEPADEFRARHFGRIEFELAAHAVENVAWFVIGQELEIDAAGLNLAGIEAQHAVIKTYGGHPSTPIQILLSPIISEFSAFEIALRTS
jgi:hypothetical protein